MRRTGPLKGKTRAGVPRIQVKGDNNLLTTIRSASSREHRERIEDEVNNSNTQNDDERSLDSLVYPIQSSRFVVDSDYPNQVSEKGKGHDQCQNTSPRESEEDGKSNDCQEQDDPDQHPQGQFSDVESIQDRRRFLKVHDLRQKPPQTWSADHSTLNIPGSSSWIWWRVG